MPAPTLAVGAGAGRRSRSGGILHAAPMRMRPTLIAMLAALLTFLAPPARAGALVSGYDSRYTGESAFLTVGPGRTDMFTVFFVNTGATTWRKGTSTQVNLAICAADKVTCGVASPNSTWNDGSWLSAIAYATHTQQEVAPGTIGTFTYKILPPMNVASGTHRFTGDLVLAASGQKIHPEGYYQDATCACP